ncbi:hypothetical protein SAMN02745246_00643 [Leeuwenhoekiella marinoflava DSM 3653]|uniref:SpoIIAA-like protein n=2 Tax=Leeuwenhoekiella marinoflava TaxID=988 RepID=A0A4Q0PS88_9FLAO|nr:hypothetical protein DSL99_585 [Leeuwenhoekiella marinoflava]SHE57369.1 hypothetical protein SAMN02745246_00643 [Leeuwenhoekiella marinoflava DSM 3653]
MNSIKTQELDFCILTFYPNFVISEIKEGISLNAKQIAEAHKTITNFFGEGNYYGYISFRVNDYNVNPTDYLTCPFYKYITGMAVVSDQSLKRETANFEKAFFKKPLEVFFTLEEAITWITNLLCKDLNKKADL